MTTTSLATIAKDEQSEDKPYWLRQPGEPMQWYRRFTHFRKQSGRRSVRRVFLDEQRKLGKRTEEKISEMTLPTHWANMARRYHWEERALAYDNHIEIEQEALIREERIRNFNERLANRNRGVDKVLELIDALDPRIHELRAGDLFKSLALLHEDARKDLEDPKKKEEQAPGSVAFNFQDLVALAQKFERPRVQDNPETTIREVAEESPEYTEESSVEGEFTEIK